MQEQEFAPIQRFHQSAWDDLERPLEAHELEAGKDYGPAEPMNWTENCAKCRGSGKFISWSGRIVGACLACKGAGTKSYRTAPEQRSKTQARSQQAKVNKAQKLAAEAQTWKEANPAEAQWIVAKAPSFGFAQAMADALSRYGALTERQMETVQRLAAQDIERNAARAAEKAKTVEAAPEISIEPIEKAFAAAQALGKKRPKLKLAGFTFSLAPDHGVNAGAIYVKRGEEYLGKIAQGKLLKVRTCEEVTAAEIVKVAADPKGEAIAYGRRTGNCCICNRELTNKESIEMGIGPICAEKWGW